MSTSATPLPDAGCDDVPRFIGPSDAICGGGGGNGLPSGVDGNGLAPKARVGHEPWSSEGWPDDDGKGGGSSSSSEPESGFREF